MELIFNDYGIEILKESYTYFLRFDSGELASSYETIEISKLEAEFAMQSSNNAYSLIIRYQNKKLGLDG